MFRSASRTPCPQSHTWRTLMVPDWRLGGWGHPWRHGSSWYVILDLCTKFQLCSMIRSASRTPPSSKSYLEDAEGSWLETWRMGSSLTCWIILEDPQELTLKVWCQYLLIWPSYGDLISYPPLSQVKHHCGTTQFYIKYHFSALCRPHIKRRQDFRLPPTI